MKNSTILVTQYPHYTTLNLPELDKLQEEIKFLKQQIKFINRKQKKRSWNKKYGRL